MKKKNKLPMDTKFEKLIEKIAKGKRWVKFIVIFLFLMLRTPI